jgi:hypothetical protein
MTVYPSNWTLTLPSLMVAPARIELALFALGVPSIDPLYDGAGLEAADEVYYRNCQSANSQLVLLKPTVYC